MIITYEGVSCVRIQQGDLVVVCNPVSKQSKFKPQQFGADIALITTNHPDCNGVESVTRKDKEPFVIKGPGEYEVNGLIIRGLETKTNYGGDEKINTVYVFEIDGINVAFLGMLSDSDLPSEVKEKIGDIDILFVPIGGNSALDASSAYKMAVKREPKIIIPVMHDSSAEKGSLSTFIDEAGKDNVEKVDKLTIKRKDIEKASGDVIVINSNS